MKITLISTDLFTELRGAQCRIWLGTTARGVPVTAFIAGLGFVESADRAEVEAELLEWAPLAPGLLL